MYKYKALLAHLIHVEDGFQIPPSWYTFIYWPCINTCMVPAKPNKSVWKKYQYPISIYY